MAKLTTIQKRNPLLIASILAGAIWGLDAARLLGNGWLVNGFNQLSVVVLFVLLCTGVSVGLMLVARKHDTDIENVVFFYSALVIPVTIDLILPGFSVLRSVLLLLTGVVTFTLHRITQRHVGMVLSIAVPFVVYLLDISPFVGRADTFEFQVVAPTLGIAHPSGYPLYILLGKLFSWLPFGSSAWRVNLSSAVFSALACGVIYWILSDVSLRDRYKMRSIAVPVIAAWILGFSPTLWSRSIEAEVYALNAFIVSVALYLGLCWQREGARLDTVIPLYGLVTGLALASHITLGAIGLLAGVILLTRRPWPKLRSLIFAALLGLAGLSLYLYIPLRWPALHQGEWMSMQQFFDFVTNAGSGGALHPLAFYQDPSRWGLVWRLFTQQFTVLGILLAVVGWGAWLRQQWRFAVGTLFMVMAWVWFNLGFYVADPDYSAFLIPAHVVVVLWMGYGVYALLQLLTRYQKWAFPIFLSLVVLLPAMHVWQVLPTLDTRSQGMQDELWARYVLDLPVESDAAILADSEKFPPLYYLQQVEGIRPDIEMVTLFNEEQYRTDMHQRLESGQAVYMARYLPGLDIYGVGSLGPLVEVAPQATKSTRPPVVVFQPGNLALMSWSLQPDPYGRSLSHLSLEWYAREDIQEDFELHVRLRDDSTGTTVWTFVPHRPVSGYSATTAWQAEQVINDYYALEWPEWLAGDPFVLEIALYQRFSDKAQYADADDIWFPLEIVDVPATSSSPWRGVAVAHFNGQGTLMEATFPADVFAGIPLNIDLRWSCTSLQADGGGVFSWTADSGERLSQAVAPVTGAYDESAQCVSSVLRRYEVTAPAEPGDYTLSIGWLGENGHVISVQCNWLGAQQQDCDIGKVHVGPSVAGIANYENTILLVDAAFDAGDVPAGGMMQVYLDWRGLREMDLDYTVFLQVIGPDGQIYGQVDSWPVQGARPTSGWEPGEEIHDPYAFYLKEGWPSGEYEIIAGWYLLADMRRLVIYSDGLPMGDYSSIGDFTLP